MATAGHKFKQSTEAVSGEAGYMKLHYAADGRAYLHLGTAQHGIVIYVAADNTAAAWTSPVTGDFVWRQDTARLHRCVSSVGPIWESPSLLVGDLPAEVVLTNSAKTITAQHTFAPDAAQAPFVLGANAQGQLVPGLNADQLDGNEATAFSLSGYTHTTLPTQDQKDALAGTGTPSSSNVYVTDDDSRLTDVRTPTTHASTHQDGGTDEIATATPTANAIPKAGADGQLAAGWLSTLEDFTVLTNQDLFNGWEVIGSWQPLCYTRDISQKIGVVVGYVQAGSAADVYTLPVGFRPAYYLGVPGWGKGQSDGSAHANNRVRIGTDGVISLSLTDYGSGANMSFFVVFPLA